MEGDNIELRDNSGGGGASNDEDGFSGPSSYTPTHSSVYETKYTKSLRHYLTREALPSENNYRNLQSIVEGPNRPRPTLEMLHEANMDTVASRSKGSNLGDAEAGGAKQLSGKVIKFGWLQGVYMRCLLNIWGVMLFLRVSWMVGQCGVIQALAVVVCANIVTFITTLSMSAVATNGIIQAGGVYYMISRSLGPEFGASIGLMFTIANSIAVSTYLIGFVNSFQDMMLRYFNTELIDGGVNDVRVIGIVSLVLILILAIVGMDWVTKVQMGLLVLLVISQINFIIGACVGPFTNDEISRGFVGLNMESLRRNMYSNYRVAENKPQGFFSVFAVFFPAVTGIVAGANLSGDLQNPGEAIPKGTLLAIFTTFITYITYPIFIAGGMTRDASGNVAMLEEYLVNNTMYTSGNLTLLDAPVFSPEICSTAGDGVPNLVHPNATTCHYGTHNDFQVMELMSLWGPLIYAGCYAATLSSAIASLVGAPRVLQALAKDRIYPGIFFFSQGYGANNDPFRGYVLVFLASACCIMIGDLNAVSTLLSNFFLASYCLINFSCFHASLVKSPGWRPAFKYYNQWVSCLGALLCIIVMFLIDYTTALITFICIVFLYIFVSYRKPDVNWGSSTQGATYLSALKHSQDLQTIEEHVKNFRPQILVLCGRPMQRPPLLDLGNLLTKNLSLLICGHVVNNVDWRTRKIIKSRGYKWLASHKLKAFYDVVDAENLEAGTKSMFQLSGLGKLTPNTVLMGYKSDWKTAPREELKAYFNTLHGALSSQLGIALLRLPYSLDFSDILEDEDGPLTQNTTTNGSPPDIADSLQQQGQLAQDGAGSEASSPPGTPSAQRREDIEVETDASKKKAKNRRGSLSNIYLGPGGTKLSKENVNKITVFQKKQKKGTIDVWWLYDDGGLTILLAHILTTRTNWAGNSIRVFALGNKREQLDSEQRSMANLLNKFRIDFTDVTMMPNAATKPSKESMRLFDDMIKEFKTEDEVGDGVNITETEYISQKDKTHRHIRLREMIQENSMDANLIVMTLPMPRKNHVSAALYMSWLEYVTQGANMPPFLFVRGNQQSVLTFYS